MAAAAAGATPAHDARYPQQAPVLAKMIMIYARRKEVVFTFGLWKYDLTAISMRLSVHATNELFINVRQSSTAAFAIAWNMIWRKNVSGNEAVKRATLCRNWLFFCRSGKAPLTEITRNSKKFFVAARSIITTYSGDFSFEMLCCDVASQ